MTKHTNCCIIGGYEANEGDFKYQVSIQVNNVHICGGSIIGNYFVLTAASCFYKNKKFQNLPYKIVAGGVNLKSINVSKSDLNKVYVPVKYLDGLLSNDHDIAAVLLKSSLNLIKFNSQIGKLNLPQKNYEYAGPDAVVCGFGVKSIRYIKDEVGTTEYHEKTDHLRYANVTVFDGTSNCTRNSGPFLQITDQVICGQVRPIAISRYGGTCMGDRGSGLVVDSKIIGVLVVHTQNCDETRLRSIYVKVASHLDFIDSVRKNNVTSDVRVQTLGADQSDVSSGFYKYQSLLMKLRPNSKNRKIMHV
ncbi:trypsin-7-like [Copidosoma floridanum]|uniref:trypsin-7-like n=1 Tax=Copidosoma floridanum TaxID=29053 RepID=UPI000C6F79DB|nr:trypsin-7-like [Copidosoma floridanum]